MIFVFPGQGSQHLAMGKDLYNNFQEVKLLFEEVNDAINCNLSRIIFDGPLDKLNSTEYTQPAIMLVSVATVRVLEKESGEKINNMAKYVMGHSLGEYSALCATRSLSLADTAKLLQIRGQAMQNAAPLGKGTMIALLGATMKQVEEIVNKIEDCEIANDNGGGQIVLSCLVSKCEEVKKLAINMKIKRVLQLPVSAPFHSSFMQPAADKMQEVLNDVNMNIPSIPLISNVTADEMTDVTLIKDCLVRQVVSMVRWEESVLYCMRKKVNYFVELGPGKVLTNLIKRIDKSNFANSINDVDKIKSFLMKNFH
ncbi:MAG: ACP S-malonyltransferase [Rickettsiaceae bacterium H1]|nr:ACP S-malonyltransferase [Rickettsiaceae bacterium H1]